MATDFGQDRHVPHGAGFPQTLAAAVVIVVRYQFTDSKLWLYNLTPDDRKWWHVPNVRQQALKVIRGLFETYLL